MCQAQASPKCTGRADVRTEFDGVICAVCALALQREHHRLRLDRSTKAGPTGTKLPRTQPFGRSE